MTAGWWRATLLGFAGGALIVFVAYEMVESEPAVTLAGEVPTDLDAAERNVVETFQRVSPSVVNVYNIAQRRFFFSLDVMQIPQGSGTGFVWDKEGHIVTNYHLIHNADAVEVSFADQTARPAEIVGEYPNKDLAVLKIDYPRDKLTPVVPGSSHNLLVGQTVLAIGNPFGLDHTLTTGVVSALGREIKALNNFPITDVIQTDAAINPGNSGGPLLDSRGRLIGVNTAIFSPSGSSAGIGFAVPVDTVKMIVKQLIEHGRVVRPGLGVYLWPDSVADRLGIQGVVIRSVPRRSAAEAAGLRGTLRTERGEVNLGDVIVAVDGKKVRSHAELILILEQYQIGNEVEVTSLRNGRERKTKVKLQSLASDD